MLTTLKLEEILKEAFEAKQAHVLADAIFTSYNELVKANDFAELKGIVKEMAEVQKESRKEISRLDKTMQELAEAQKRTEIQVERLVEAQEKTEKEIRMLTKELKDGVGNLSESLRLTRGDFGGLSRSMGYALENEAFRILPKALKEKYGVEISERLVRADIGGKEINVYGKGKMNGKDILIVGEAKLRLDERRKEREEIFNELEDKVEVVRKEEGEVEVLRLLITHFATKGFLREAGERGIIVIQSFEW